MIEQRMTVKEVADLAQQTGIFKNHTLTPSVRGATKTQDDTGGSWETGR